MYGGTSWRTARPQEETLLSGTQLPTSVWKHIAMTASGANYQMYIDGFPAAEVTGGVVVTPSEMEPLSPASWLGKSRFGDPYLNGTVDELRIYNRILTAPEIADLAWPQHDYSYWRFDEGTGTTAVDSSDNAITGTLSGGAGWAASGRLGRGRRPARRHLAGRRRGRAAGRLREQPARQLHARPSRWRAGSRSTPRTTGRASSTSARRRPPSCISRPKAATGMHFGMASPSGAPTISKQPRRFPADNAWHHVAVTVDASDTVTLYIDGASVAAGSAAKDAATYVKAGDFTTVTDYSLGKSRFSDPYLNGSIDDLRISCRAYTGDEIKTLAHGP